MRNQLKAALVVEAVVLVIALVFSILYVVMGWARTSHVLDVLLIVTWVLVAVVLLFVFRSRTLVREEMVRRFYLSKDWIYNHEIGYAPIGEVVPDNDAYEFVTFAGDALGRMSYGYDLKDAPQNFEPEYLITSTVFDFHLIGEEGDPQDQGVVIDQWEGVLERIRPNGKGGHDYEEIGTYENAKELALLLDSNGVMDSIGMDAR